MTSEPSPAPPPEPGAPRLLPPRARLRIAAAAAAALAAGWAAAFLVAGAAHPPALFQKYVAAAAAPPAVAAERLLDYSPLYLSLVGALARAARHLASDPDRFLFILQGLLHGLTSAAVALSVALVIGERGGGWGLAAGLGAALYRPLLAYTGVEEPETVIAFLLAAAIFLALLARARLRAGSGRSSAGPLLLSVLAFAAVTLAGLARPQHLALLPVWAAWIAAAAPRDGGRGRRWTFWAARFWIAAAAVAALLVLPLLVARAAATGAPTLMNPGAVFYEGNGPGAVGLTRFAPPAVVELERAHPESVDYGHVAYRQIAGWATGGTGAVGRRLRPAAANRYWTGLACEAMAAAPHRAAARFLRKAALALGPYEAHDLLPAEALDRRVRRLLPTGFALLLLALPWLPFARRERLADLAGPLAVGLLALAVQVATYASARQRLPLAVALWIAGPVLAADLSGGRLRGGLKPAAGLLLGLCAALWLGQAGARWALLDQLGWDLTVGPERPGIGARVATIVAVEEGRALRPALERAARRFQVGVGLARGGHPAESLAALAPLAAAGEDFTVDEKEIGLPAYWAALDLAALGDRPRASRAAAAAVAARPDDPRVRALARAMATPPEELLRTAGAWRPPGVDPASARLDLARAAGALGERRLALAILAPLLDAFPELRGPDRSDRSGR